MKYLKHAALILFLIVLGCIDTANGQDDRRQKYFQSFLDKAIKFHEQGDYLFAGKLFQHIFENTKDSTLQAEALYRYKQAGDAAASHMTKVDYLAERIIVGYNDRDNEGMEKRRDYWRKHFEPLINTRIEQFHKIGINLKVVTLYNTYYVNLDTRTPKILLNQYSQSKWAQKMRFDLITEEMDSSGYSIWSDPESVIEKAKPFLEKYPDSSLKNDVYFMLGKAYTDMWHLYQYNKHMITEKFRDKTNPESARLKALNYLKKAYEHDKSLKLSLNGIQSPVSELIKTLENKEELNVFYYYSD